MSWFRDPQLFIVCELDMQIYVVRVKKEFGSHIAGKSDLITGDCEKLSFSKHLSFGNNRESDFTHFLCYWATCFAQFINSQGLVITCTETSYPQSYTWSREKLDSPFYSLPGLSRKAPATKPLKGVADAGDRKKAAELQDLEDRISLLELTNCALKDERNREKAEKQALEKTVSVLESNNCAPKDEVGRNKDEKQALEKRVSILEASTANLVYFLMADREMESAGIDNIVSNVIEQLHVEKNNKQQLEKQVETSSSSPQTSVSKKKKKKKNKRQVSELTSKFEECCGSGSGLAGEEPSRDSKENL